jgi:hypothetical protein
LTKHAGRIPNSSVRKREGIRMFARTIWKYPRVQYTIIWVRTSIDDYSLSAKMKEEKEDIK